MCPSHAHYRPPDHSKGDESTIGGYAAVHDRPAAFEGSDGYSYSVELMTDETDGAAKHWAGFFLFVKWARLGAQSPEGHLESEYLVHGPTEAAVKQLLGQTPLADVKNLLEHLITQRNAGATTRRWWDAMRSDESDA
jgi:hypothetical protein